MQFLYMSHVTRKPVFGVCDLLRLKPACSAPGTSYGLEISAIASRGNILSRQRIKRRWSDCADAQADLRFCCSHMAQTGFPNDVAHILPSPKRIKDSVYIHRRSPEKPVRRQQHFDETNEMTLRYAHRGKGKRVLGIRNNIECNKD